MEKTRLFKDDIRRTFINYALIPVMLITTFSFFFSFFYLYRTVVKQNGTSNSVISSKLEQAVAAYMDKAQELSVNQDIQKAIQKGNVGIDVYEKIYQFVNRIGIKSDFFVFDQNKNMVIESSLVRPEYTENYNVLDFGIIGRMHDRPDTVIVERVAAVDTTNKTLTIGKAVVQGNQVIGYITFDLDNEELSRIISENYSMTVVITDRNDYIIARNNALMENKFGKIDDKLRNQSGFTSSLDDGNFITRTEIIRGAVCIYTITSIGYIGSIFVIVGSIIILLFGMLIIMTFLSARRIADRKTKVIDVITEAMGQVQQGNLDQKLDIHTNDEFQIIARSYNKMLEDIKKLIELNREKARESVVSEIQQLESQFNPHFLFNTLETIKYMCKIDPDSVNRIILGLSNILRYSIDSEISEVTLGRDIEYTENYLMIQKYRFGNRFDYMINVEEDASDCIVPKLILQPMIENSIKYGYEDKDHLTVSISASIQDTCLLIRISDDGNGMEEQQLRSIRAILEKNRNRSNHIGLHNVNRRIMLMYGAEDLVGGLDLYGVWIESQVDKGTVVEIRLPVNRGERKYA